MEIILLERIERLGQMGDIVRVKNGYARNFLLPQKKALRKTKANMEIFESKRKEYEAHNAKLKTEAEALSEKMLNLAVIIVRQAAETGQLYGSVTSRDVYDAVREAGFEIQRSQVVLNQPFKNIGIFDVRLALHPDVSVNVRVNIARTEDDAAKALKKADDDAKGAVEASEASEEVKPAKKTAKKAKAEKVEEVESAEAEVAEDKPAKKPAKKAKAEKADEAVEAEEAEKPAKAKKAAAKKVKKEE